METSKEAYCNSLRVQQLQGGTEGQIEKLPDYVNKQFGNRILFQVGCKTGARQWS